MIRRMLITGVACVALGAADHPPSTRRSSPPRVRRRRRPGRSPRRKRGARRLRADSGVARPDARAGAGEDRGVRRPDGRGRSERGVRFHFLPDGRMIWASARRQIRIVAKDGTVSEPLDGMPADLWARGQGLFEVRPDRTFATNRTIYLTYTVLPDGVDAAPRTPVRAWSRARSCRRRQAARGRRRCC